MAKLSADPSPRLSGCCWDVVFDFEGELELDAKGALEGRRRRSPMFCLIRSLSM